jgi:phospholipase/carboxylesterase
MLIVLLHGVDSTPDDMAPLRARLAADLPGALIEAPAAPGRQWFSIDGIADGAGDSERAARTRAALPALVATVHALQRQHGKAPHDTVLVGFSQGASMALAACGQMLLASRVVAIAGRCLPLPERWDARVAVRLVRRRRRARPGAAHRASAHAAPRGAGRACRDLGPARHNAGPGVTDDNIALAY